MKKRRKEVRAEGGRRNDGDGNGPGRQQPGVLGEQEGGGAIAEYEGGAMHRGGESKMLRSQDERPPGWTATPRSASRTSWTSRASTATSSLSWRSCDGHPGDAPGSGRSHADRYRTPSSLSNGYRCQRTISTMAVGRRSALEEGVRDRYIVPESNPPIYPRRRSWRRLFKCVRCITRRTIRPAKTPPWRPLSEPHP
jgi:hypothetical protein